jgi:hypothetical protein
MIRVQTTKLRKVLCCAFILLTLCRCSPSAIADTTVLLDIARQADYVPDMLCMIKGVVMHNTGESESVKGDMPDLSNSPPFSPDLIKRCYNGGNFLPLPCSVGELS